jgi:hypothetical protein
VSGKLAQVAENDFSLRLWDPQTGQERSRLEGHTAAIFRPGLLPDGKFALSSSWVRTVRLCDVDTGKAVRRFEKELPEPEWLAFAPNGRMALVGSDDGTMQLWQVQRDKEVRSFEGHSAREGNISHLPGLYWSNRRSPPLSSTAATFSPLDCRQTPANSVTKARRKP